MIAFQEKMPVSSAQRAKRTLALAEREVFLKWFESDLPIAILEIAESSLLNIDPKMLVREYFGEVQWAESVYPLVARTERQSATTCFEIAGHEIGGTQFTLIGGPCAVEDEEQILETARGVKAAGVQFLRGGAYKPRTSPYRFDGLKNIGMELLALAKEKTGLGICTEILSERDVDRVAQVADLLQVGARNMQNFALLHEVGRSGHPVLLKRGFGCSVEEMLHAAEHLLAHGTKKLLLMERGIRTFESSTRFTFDANAVAILKRETHLPVLVDPSHATGRRELLLPVARSAAALGCDGVMFETHPSPANAKSDGEQSLPLSEVSDFLGKLTPIVEAMGRTMPLSTKK
ncbi:MAG: 3-deoxy-7-phosphoheptulonate synthase [Deltaproteobacteria bacterium]|nr:3-deoxy-7-phosphoheptulonate synthase [Deltaproteobacteria bacterium]